MTGPLWALALLSIVALVLGLPAFGIVGSWGELFARFTHPVFAQAIAAAGIEEHAPVLWPFVVAWLVAIVFGWLGYSMYAGRLRGLPGRFVEAYPALWRFTVEKFRVDELYEWLILKPIQRVAAFLARVGDALLIDGLFVNGTARTARAFGMVFRTFQNGDVQRYAAVLALGAVAILWAVLGGGH